MKKVESADQHFLILLRIQPPDINNDMIRFFIPFAGHLNRIGNDRALIPDKRRKHILHILRLEYDMVAQVITDPV